MGKKEVHRHLPGKYHSEPNVAAILLGRLDLRVDRKQFKNHMKIHDSLSAVSHVSLSRIGTGRHGGRPSQMPRAKVIAKKLSASAPLREITVPAKPPPTPDCLESPGVKPVATKKAARKGRPVKVGIAQVPASCKSSQYRRYRCYRWGYLDPMNHPMLMGLPPRSFLPLELLR